jgi:hypothetical protein
MASGGRRLPFSIVLFVRKPNGGALPAELVLSAKSLALGVAGVTISR